ncbi:MAG TPA: hypothetical protein PKZ41_04370, partial [Candidatus Omnitrophota bacterium]|nr:hypothetical protein [Candidatus Omnitrophota bacterium]
ALMGYLEDNADLGGYNSGDVTILLFSAIMEAGYGSFDRFFSAIKYYAEGDDKVFFEGVEGVTSFAGLVTYLIQNDRADLVDMALSSALVPFDNLVPAAENAVLSHTKYDGTRLQRMLYTWNMESAVLYDASGIYGGKVADTTLYDYQGGQYLIEATTFEGQVTEPDSLREVISVSRYDGTRFQRMERTWNMSNGTLYDVYGVYEGDVADTTFYDYGTGRYLLQSITLLGKLESYSGASGFLKVLKEKASGNLLAFLQEIPEGIPGIMDLMGYLALSASENGFTPDDVTELVLSSVLSINGGVEEFLSVLKSSDSGNILGEKLSEMTAQTLSDNGIISMQGLITYLEDGAFEGGYETDDVSKVIFNAIMLAAYGSFQDYFNELKGTVDDETRNFLETVDIEALGIDTIAGFLTYLEQNIEGYDPVEAEGTIFGLILAPFDYLVPSSEKAVLSRTEYDGSRYQRMKYTWNMESGTLFQEAGTYDGDVADSVVYNYAGGQYLVNSTNLYGKVTEPAEKDDLAEPPVAGDKVISFTSYDGTRFQRMNYTWNMAEAVTYDAAGAYEEAEVADSTVYDYDGGNYIAHSTSLYGQVTHLTADTTTQKVISYTTYDVSRYQRVREVWSMSEAVSYSADGEYDGLVDETTVYNYGPVDNEGAYMLSSTTF